MNKKQKSLTNKGFSLVELIIVIAIMAVLVGVLAPQYLKYVHNSKVSTDITNAQEMATAINVAVADQKVTTVTSDTTATGATLTTLMQSTAASEPVSKLGGTWGVIYNTTDGVKEVTLTVDSKVYSCYPNPDQAEDATNSVKPGLNTLKK